MTFAPKTNTEELTDVPFYIPVSSVYKGSDFSACSSPLINVCLGDYFEGFWVSHIAQGSH